MPNWSDLDDYVQEAMGSWNCPGVAIGVVRGDEVLHRAAYGLRDVGRDLPLTAETRFAMASVTKSFTAMSIALLVDEGKMGWDTPVREYLPELKLHDAYASEHLTARDMLSHRSGLPRHDLAAWRIDLPLADFVKRLRHLRPSASFRERFQYNNLMYNALAYVVERVAGQRWEDFVHERIFQPLGMNGSNFDPEPPQDGQVNALGYRIERDEQGHATDLVVMPFGAHTEVSPGAAGALFSTLDDQLRWVSLHANRGRWGDVQLVAPNTCEQMHLPVTIRPPSGIASEMLGHNLFTYGLGWAIEPYQGRVLVQHGGNVEGHSLMVGFMPSERIGVVALCNAAGTPLRDALLYELIDRGLGLASRDWSARFHGVYDHIFKGLGQGKATTVLERREDAPTSHGTEAYTGTFHTDGYPDAAVRLQDGALQMRLLGSLDWAPLQHVHFDVFNWDLSDFFETVLRVRFQTDEHGEIDAVAIGIEPAVDDIVFRRVPLELPAEVLEALPGVYATPIEGLSFTVALTQGKLYATASKGKPEELQPYLLTEGTVGLRQGRRRFEFKRVGDQIIGLTIKEPGLTLEATRVTAI